VKKVICFILAAAMLVAIASCSKQEKAIELTFSADNYAKTTLPNGIQVIVNQDKTTSLSAARVLIGGGVTSETSANNGVTNLMVRMLLKGNAGMTAAQISERLDFLGATVSADCFRDYSALTISSLSENFDQVLEIISASLTSPTFPDAELTKLKVEVDGDIKGTKDNQTQVSSDLFWKTIYGDQGYGLPTIGTSESVARVTMEDIKKQYETYVGGKNIVVAIATDLPAEQLGGLISKRFGGIKTEATKVTPPSVALQESKGGFIPFQRNQSFVYMGYALDRVNAKEAACLGLLNQVMGGPVGSRLWGLRQKEKLAYAVYTQWIPSNYSSVFRAAIGTDTTKITQALASLNREWSKLLDSGITPLELSDAKVNLKNNLIYGIDRKIGRASNMAFYEYIGYSYRYILDQIALADQITLDDVNAFVKSRLTPDRQYLAIVGKK
jgi:zinc protease